MATKEQKEKLLESANNYLQLGRLLKKNRGSWASREVEKILLLSIRDEEKIDQILRVDKLAIQQQKILKRKKSHQDRELDTPQPIKKIDNPPERIYKKSFLSYLLFEYRKIAHFGKETHTLVSRFPGLPFQLDPQIGDSLFEIQKMIAELLDPLTYLIEHGWVDLTKEEYNLLVEFYEFCDQYYKEFLQDFDYTDLVLIQKQFLTVIQSDSYRCMLIESIQKGLRNHQLYSITLDEIIIKIKKIIEMNDLTPSLTHILMAILMKDMNTFCRIKDLIFTENIPFIKRNRYHAKEEILNNIRHYIWQKEQIYNDITKKYKYLLFIRNRYIPDWMSHPFDFLKRFSHLNRGEHHSDKDFRTNIDDLGFFLLTLIKEYLRVFKQFTMDKVSLVLGEDTIIRERIIPYALDRYFRQLEEDYRLIEDLLRNGQIEKINFHQFKQYINNDNNPTDKEFTLYYIINSLSQNFYEISYQLYKNYLNDSQFNQFPVNERIKTIQDKDFFEKTIPYGKGKLNLNYFLSDKKVVDAYLELIHFSVEFSLFFYNQEIINLFKNELSLKGEVTNLSALIQRMK